MFEYVCNAYQLNQFLKNCPTKYSFNGNIICGSKYNGGFKIVFDDENITEISGKVLYFNVVDGYISLGGITFKYDELHEVPPKFFIHFYWG